MQHCLVCSKRLRLATAYECKCGSLLCPQHKYKDQHECSINPHETFKEELEKKLIAITPPKIEKI